MYKHKFLQYTTAHIFYYYKYLDFIHVQHTYSNKNNSLLLPTAAFSIVKPIEDFQSPIKGQSVAELLFPYRCNSAEHKNVNINMFLWIFFSLKLEILSMQVIGKQNTK